MAVLKLHMFVTLCIVFGLEMILCNGITIAPTGQLNSSTSPPNTTVILSNSSIPATNTTVILSNSSIPATNTTVFPSNSTTPPLNITTTLMANTSVFSTVFITSSYNHSVVTTAHGNASIHNFTVHPTLAPSPTASHNFSFTIIMTSVFPNASKIVPSQSINASMTTSILPTTSIAPTMPPPPPLPKGKYSVKTRLNSTCLLLWLSMDFNVTYKNSLGKQVTQTVTMPSNGTSSGYCGDILSSIRIYWEFYSVEIYFETAKTLAKDPLQHWVTENITITVNMKNNTAFDGGNVTQIKETVGQRQQLEWLSGKLGHSLNCSQITQVKLGNHINANFSGVRVQPFKVAHDKFNEADSCNPQPTTSPAPSLGKKSNNTVAIAVGCSLGGLVLIVLIGYFIGRRKKRASTGYRKL